MTHPIDAPHPVDVIVVGAGPSGLTLAGDLARAGRRVTVLERRPEAGRTSRAFAVMPRTLEVLDARGLTDGLLSTGGRAGRVEFFHGAALDLTRGETRFPFALITPQTHVDEALAGYAAAHGAVVRRGVEVTALAQDEDGVAVTTGDGATHRAAYVVAADGAHSTVRDLLGVPFPGRSVLRSVVLADVRLTAGGTDGGLEAGSTRTEFGFLAPYGRIDERGGGWYRSMTWDRRHQVADDVPVDLDDVGRVLTQALGATSASSRSAGTRGSTATSARSRATATAGCSSSATRRTSTPPSAVRA